MATHVKRSVEDAAPVRAAYAQVDGGPALAEEFSTIPASSVLTGFPGARIGHSETGGQRCEDPASGVLTGYPGDRSADHVHPRSHGLDDPAAGVLTGYPGARVAHSEAGGQAVDDPAAGVLTGYPGDRTGGHVATDALGIRSTGAGTSEGDAGSGHE